ncbi:MAG: glycosyltransferase, partial [Bacteroidia bacterium]|nr:glycosyltransferase [Bacteroidia bacterium]MDW8335031.1 glycosyltransferase [Bacteroidia bacterium]
YREITALIREFKPDVVHTHSSKAGALGRLAASRLGVRAIVHTFHGHPFHSYFGPLKTRFFLAVERFLARKSHAIVAISPTQKRELAETYRLCSPEKIYVVPNGFDLARFACDRERRRIEFRRLLSLSDDDAAVGIIGRFVPIKNHTLFLRAFARVKRTLANVKAVLVGGGSEKSAALKCAADLGLKTVAVDYEEGFAPVVGDYDAIFLHWVKNIENILPGLDVVALSSLNEGTPATLIEAQASGVAVVSTRVGGVEDAVAPGFRPFLAPSGDVEALARSIETMVRQPDLRRRLACEGENFVRAVFSYERLVADMARLYKRLLGIG